MSRAPAIAAIALLITTATATACDKDDGRIVYGNERWVQQQTLYELQEANRIAKRANRIAQRAAQAREREARRAEQRRESERRIARWRGYQTNTR